MNLNKAIIAGRLTTDPRIAQTTSGQPVATFAIATNRVWMTKNGERKEDVQFHNIVVWGRQAEIAARFLKKGSTALVEGKIQTRMYEKAGIKHYITEIICEHFEYMYIAKQSDQFSPDENFELPQGSNDME